MTDDRKTWAVVLGTVAGVTAVALAVTWYVRSRTEEPIRDVQDAIGRAFDKVKEIERIATMRPAE